MTWHGYIYVENTCGLVWGSNFLLLCQSLGDLTDQHAPFRTHSGSHLDGVFIESEFDETTDLTTDNFKTLLSQAFFNGAMNVPVGSIAHRADTPNFVGVAGSNATAFIYNGLDYVRVTFLAGIGSSWEDSHAQAKALIKAGALYSSGDPAIPATLTPPEAPLLNEVYVADDANPDGDGTIGNPLPLWPTLGTKYVEDGGTIRIRGGLYGGTKTFSVSGSVGLPVIYEAYNHELVNMDGTTVLAGDNVDLIETNHYNSAYTDRTATSEAGAGGDGANVVGTGVRLINCTIHDFSQGVTSGATSGVGMQIIGCLLYHDGWQSNLGHGTYSQNNGPGAKEYRDCIVIDNMGYGFHFFASGSDVNNFTINGCFAINNGSPLQNVSRPNIIYDSSSAIESPTIFDSVIVHSLLAGQNYVGDPDNPTNDIEIYDNFLIGVLGGECLKLRGSVIDITRLDGNTFIGSTAGFDTGVWATNTYLVAYPTVGEDVFLRGNVHDANRANLMICNWTLGNTVDIDVSLLFGASGTVNVRNVQDYFNDIQSLAITAGIITVNMEAVNRTVATPMNWALGAPAKTFPRFGCFVLEKVA